MESITELLLALEQSDDDGTCRDAVYRAVYPELRGMAARFMSRESPGHTLQPTALVNEAYLRLVDHESIGWRSRGHFFALAARVMRRVLVDHARTRSRLKRGGDHSRVTLDDLVVTDGGMAEGRMIDVIAFDQALSALEGEHERMARVVEMRVFGGVDVIDIAVILGVSERTVRGDWSFASAWLAQHIKSARPEDRRRG